MTDEGAGVNVIFLAIKKLLMWYLSHEQPIQSYKDTYHWKGHGMYFWVPEQSDWEGIRQQQLVQTQKSPVVIHKDLFWAQYFHYICKWTAIPRQEQDTDVCWWYQNAWTSIRPERCSDAAGWFVCVHWVIRKNSYWNWMLLSVMSCIVVPKTPEIHITWDWGGPIMKAKLLKKLRLKKDLNVQISNALKPALQCKKSNKQCNFCTQAAEDGISIWESHHTKYYYWGWHSNLGISPYQISMCCI